MKTEDNQNVAPGGFVDLSELQSFSFKTAWRDSPEVKKSSGPSGFRSFSESRDSRGPKPDRTRKYTKTAESKQSSEPEAHKKRITTPFVPVYAVSFLPEPRPFDVILSALKKSRRAYRLFSIAQLMLQKPERFRVRMAPLPAVPAGAPTAGSAPAACFYQCTLDGVPFDSEKAVIYHVFKAHASTFFKIETLTVDPPKGEFKSIARCPLTHKLLAPPSYHRYDAIVRHHYEQHCARLPWDRFLSKIEKVNDKDLIEQWLKSMTEETQFTLLGSSPDDKGSVFRSELDAIEYLALHKKDQLVQKKTSVEFSGSHIEAMQPGPMRYSVEAVLRQQRKFPLDVSRLLVPLLRQTHFYLFKSGERKITYVSGVKRKRLDAAVPLSSSVCELIAFIETTKNCTRELILASSLGAPVSPEGGATQKDPDLVSKDLNWLISEGYVTEYEDGLMEVLSPLSPSPRQPSSDSPRLAKAPRTESSDSVQKPVAPEVASDKLVVIEPKIRGFVCVTAHPKGCVAQIEDHKNRLKGITPEVAGPQRVLILGSSTGYGLASRTTAALGYAASTFGVFFERPPAEDKPASAGFYNNYALEQEARKQGLYAESFNGDAFSKEVKDQVIERISKEMGPLDLVVYSLASPRRTDPITGEVYKSALKPIGEAFESKSLDTDKHRVTTVQLEAASNEEIEATRKVMGGEDWELWIQALEAANLLAPGVKVVAYSYMGPQITFPIYRNGTIGMAKNHLEHTAKVLEERLAPVQGHAWVALNKAIVTQASSAIPVVPLYVSLLYKVMKQKGIHEDALDQIKRLFTTQLYAAQGPSVDAQGRIRMDDLELRPDVQEAVVALWNEVNTENLESLSDYDGYKKAFFQLFGFDWPGVDYAQAVSYMPESS